MEFQIEVNVVLQGRQQVPPVRCFIHPVHSSPPLSALYNTVQNLSALPANFGRP
jgi:hypothetical protein